MPRSGSPDSLGFVLADAARLMRAAVEETITAAGLGITPGEARTLLHIAVLDRPRQIVVAERMGIEAMTLCGYVDRLEAQGLVLREPDSNDRRAKIVTLSAEGEELVGKLRSATGPMFEQVTEPLGKGGDEKLRQMLLTLRATLQGRRNG